MQAMMIQCGPGPKNLLCTLFWLSPSLADWESKAQATLDTMGWKSLGLSPGSPNELMEVSRLTNPHAHQDSKKHNSIQ